MYRFLLTALLCQCLILTIFAQAPAYVPNTIIVKLDETSERARGVKAISISMLSKTDGVLAIKGMRPTNTQNQNRPAASILDGMYRITLNSAVEEQAFIEQLADYGNIIYAERYPNVRPLDIPNDPQAKANGAQYYLTNIRAYDAWTNTTGNAALKIAIIDTGVDLNHEDLYPNLYTNENDVIDGVDNDGDGYIDNYYGWDFADNDNDVQADNDPHGTFVAGVAAAATNNGIAMAGVGYNTQFMPIKIFSSSNNVSYNSYDAIIYAADKGCDVINLSWGSTSGYYQFAQDIINYAVLEKNAVVVAAAGNTNALLDFYPASYDHVLSVGYTDEQDIKSAAATYSNLIDLVAPGEAIYTTTNNDEYTFESGSSLSAPMVAGAAALVKAFNPTYDALEIMEQIRVNTDDIYGIGGNESYNYLLGSGRLNVFKAINNRNSPSVRISDFSYFNGFENAAYYGDTLSLSITISSLLADVENLSISLESENAFVQLIDSSWSVGSLAEGVFASNPENTFKLVLSNDLPENEILYLRFKMNGAFYEGYQTIRVRSNPKSEIVQFNNWEFSLSSTANIGINISSPYYFQHVKYNGTNILKHQGLAVVASADSISKNIAISPFYNNYSEDFESREKLKRFHDITGDLDVRSSFEELSNVSKPLGVKFSQRILGWNEPDAAGFLLLNYELQNLGGQNFDSLYFDIFSDWAVISNEYNKLAYDASSGIVYASDTANNFFAGIGLLTTGDSLFSALDIGAFNGHTSDLVNDSLTNQQLYDRSAQAFNKVAAGQLSQGNDIASIFGLTLYDFSVGDRKSVNFALLAGGSLAELQNSFLKAATYLPQIDTLIPFGAQIYLCNGENAAFFDATADSLFIYSSPTAELSSFRGDTLFLNQVSADTTLYYETRAADGFISRRKRLLVRLTKPIAHFNVLTSPYLIDPESTTLIQFTDESVDGFTRHWNFGNGYQSAQEQPSVPYTEAGTFAVELISFNTIGCSDTIAHTIETAFRGPQPKVSDQLVCSGSTVEIFDPALNEIHVYADSLATDLIYQGPLYSIDNIQESKSIYVRNETETYPSLIKKVVISIAEIQASMTVGHDVNSSSELLRALAINQSIAEKIEWHLRGEIIGTGDSLYFNSMNYQAGDLLLIAYNTYGCADTASYLQQPSEAPIFEDYILCRDQSVLIIAENSSAMYFYQDVALTEFIGKGSLLQLDNVSIETVVYAVNVEEIIPSEVVKVPLYISNVLAGFSLSNDTINLAFEETVSAAAEENKAISWNWDLGNGTVKSGQTIVLNYQEPGIYKLVLSVEDSLGCVESAFKEVVVLNNPLLGNKDQLMKFFKLFPNPANQFIHLEGENNFTFDAYKIIDVNGRVLLSSNKGEPSLRAKVINTSGIKEGIYFLVIQKDGNDASFMFMIKR